jgi:hypothetical protein
MLPHQNFSIIQESQSNISYNGLHELSLFGKMGKLMEKERISKQKPKLPLGYNQVGRA